MSRTEPFIGRGECGLQSLKNETVDGVADHLRAIQREIAGIASREELNQRFPAQSARNAVDCALWDLECKRSGRSIWDLAELTRPERLEVDITIGLDTLDKMIANAVVAVGRGYRLLKLKADAQSVVENVAAISEATSGVQFIVDANEAWSIEQLREVAPRLQSLGVILIEQPLHHDLDGPLAGFDSPIPICADESCATASQIDALADRYQAVNIKLDKSGGLTEALNIAHAARAKGMGLMMGCNGATSLGNAPGYVVGSLCQHRDLDSQELLFEDRQGGMATRNGELCAFESGFWG